MTKDEQETLGVLTTHIKYIRDKADKIEKHLEDLNGNVALNTKAIAVIQEKCYQQHRLNGRYKKVGIGSGAILIGLYVLYSLGVILGWWPPLIS